MLEQAPPSHDELVRRGPASCAIHDQLLQTGMAPKGNLNGWPTAFEKIHLVRFGDGVDPDMDVQLP